MVRLLTQWWPLQLNTNFRACSNQINIIDLKENKTKDLHLHYSSTINYQKSKERKAIDIWRWFSDSFWKCYSYFRYNLGVSCLFWPNFRSIILKWIMRAWLTFFIQRYTFSVLEWLHNLHIFIGRLLLYFLSLSHIKQTSDVFLPAKRT